MAVFGAEPDMAGEFFQGGLAMTRLLLSTAALAAMIPISTNIAFAAPPPESEPGPPHGCLGESFSTVAQDPILPFNLGFLVSSSAQFEEDERIGFGDSVQEGLSENCGIGSEAR
jgi:hypothetical protein